MDEAATQRLSKVADQLEIAGIIHAYAQAIDRKDAALLMSCFHPEATFQVSDQPPAPVAAFFAASAPNSEGLRATSHHISNHLVVVDGDVADSQVYFQAYHLVGADAPDRPPLFPAKGEAYGVVIGGRYVDRFQRRDGHWRILNRALYFDWSFSTDGPQIPLTSPAATERKA